MWMLAHDTHRVKIINVNLWYVRDLERTRDVEYEIVYKLSLAPPCCYALDFAVYSLKIFIQNIVPVFKFGIFKFFIAVAWERPTQSSGWKNAVLQVYKVFALDF